MTKYCHVYFYLATDNSNKENGTQILKPIKNVKKFGDKHMRWYDFKKLMIYSLLKTDLFVGR